MRLHVIGNGCPTPVPRQFGSAFVLEIGGESLLVDCGPATTYKMVRMGLSPLSVHRVFLTHHHFDHNVDLPCFALARWDMGHGDEPPLRVCGPRPTRRFIDLLLRRGGAFAPDWQSRLAHPASLACHQQRGGLMPRPGPLIEAFDLDDGQVESGDAWAATAVHVEHVEPGLLSLAYRFDADGGSIVFAGDCADCPALRRLAVGADTLIIACTHFGDTETRPEIAAVITGTPEVAAIGAEAGVRRVVLTHVSPHFSRPGVRERAIAAVAASYAGEIVFPEELDTLDLSRSPG